MNFVDKIFEYELSLIKSKETKQFVLDVFDKLCPDYFWTCPCSTSGKYHPQVSLGEGGLVRHTKLAVWWGIELLRVLSEEPELKDIPTLQDEVVATLLLHDLLKNGKGLGPNGRPLESGVTGTHGVTLAQRIVSEELDNELSLESCERIFDGIAGHMGVWTIDPFYRPSTAFANLIHLADYCASRKVDDIYAVLQEEKEV
ncbi:hypothetical protein LCGC14_0422980 [marine sediment metagenome]|uniref:HD domain-containing protein n=1 Tax=marine sediment metagenome TaxID=412755 RepID=A0A0F9SQF1_9ZZZZ